MQQTVPSWTKLQIEQYKKQTQEENHQAMLSDEHTLDFFASDFGRLIHSYPAAVFKPSNDTELSSLIHYANQEALPVTIRGKGLSQSGQSLSLNGSLIVSMEARDAIISYADHLIWVEPNVSWASLINRSLTRQEIPLVLPYNCQLSVAGVISAGGVGASSFKHGVIASHVKALELITASGEIKTVDASSPLFHACLGGQGRFAVINKVAIELAPCKKSVRTYMLLYTDKERAFEDLRAYESQADYLEFFCTPAAVGAKTIGDKRRPFAEWFYAIHVALSYDKNPPAFASLWPAAKPWKILHVQDEPIQAYLLRHEGRFEAMKLSGQWDLLHPWYECFVTEEVLAANIDKILAMLPLHYATVLQIVPIANKQYSGFMMLPNSERVFALMILNPGLPNSLVPSSVDVISSLDKLLLPQGGKRYLSGFLGYELPENYWQQHFGESYQNWRGLKKLYDPKGIFKSMLHRE